MVPTHKDHQLRDFLNATPKLLSSRQRPNLFNSIKCSSYAHFLIWWKHFPFDGRRMWNMGNEFSSMYVVLVLSWPSSSFVDGFVHSNWMNTHTHTHPVLNVREQLSFNKFRTKRRLCLTASQSMIQFFNLQWFIRGWRVMGSSNWTRVVH